MSILERFSLSGKVALVTGGSGLYGRQIVLALAQAGAKVYTASRNLQSNEAYAEGLQKKGLSVAAAEVDQSDEASVHALRDLILEKDGRLDILVNNAVARVLKNGWDSAAEAFNESMQINATGLFIITRAFGEVMAQNGGGSIVNIGSYMGTLGPDDAMYEGTEVSGRTSPDYFFHKGGMANLTRYVASIYGPAQVRCNCLNLGGFFNNQGEKFVASYSKRTFLKRMANDTDIMGAVVYLASDASAYMTGANIALDGGYSAK